MLVTESHLDGRPVKNYRKSCQVCKTAALLKLNEDLEDYQGTPSGSKAHRGLHKHSTSFDIENLKAPKISKQFNVEPDESLSHLYDQIQNLYDIN